MPTRLFSCIYSLKPYMPNFNMLTALHRNSQVCSYTNYANEKVKEKVCSSGGHFRNSIVQRVPALGQAVNLTNRCKYVAVSVSVPGYSATLRVHAHCLE